MGERYMLFQGDVLEALRLMPDASYDCLYSDVPYGLGPKQPTVDEIVAYLQGAEMDTGGDFMNKKWTVPSVAVWREVYRVLRPGSPLFVNIAPRTADLVTIGMRAAGFEVGDMMLWMFAEGMVKSHNLAKAIDKAAGAKQEIVGYRMLTGNAALSTKEKGGTYVVGAGTAPAKRVPIHAPATPLAKAWANHGTALAPGYEPIILGWKPNDGTYVQNITKHGVGGLNIGETRVERDSDYKEKCDSAIGVPRTNQGVAYGNINGVRGDSFNPTGSWPKNLIIQCLPECTDGHVPWCPAAMLDAQAGSDHPGMASGGVHRADYGGGMFGAIDSPSTAYGDKGGPSRFYYCAKSSRLERDFGCEHLPLHTPSEAVSRKEDSVGINNGRAGAGRTGEGVRNPHPNVKPISLCEYLAVLGLPPPREIPRRVLIIYSGSGSEMVGALRAGWDEIVGVEKEPEFIEITRARLVRWAQVPASMSVAEALGETRIENKKRDPKQTSMFK